MTWRGQPNQLTGDHRGWGEIRAKLPDEAAGEVLAHAYAVRDAPTPGAARPATDLFLDTCGREYPVVERSVVEGRRRTTVIVRFNERPGTSPGGGWELIGSSVTVVVARPLMTKIETNMMVVRLYFGAGLPVSFAGDPRWPVKVGFDGQGSARRAALKLKQRFVAWTFPTR
jgi:hypothetical protein